MGYQLWAEEIDPQCLLIVPRKGLDEFLAKAGVVKDYKATARFMAGVLSGDSVRGRLPVKRSQFMKLILKGVLRDAVKNILAFSKLGSDTAALSLNKEASAAAIVPLSHQVARLQRYILYCGIKTKNSQGVPIADDRDFLDRSQACAEIVTTLQHLKDRGKRVTLDRCKIEMAEHQAWLKKHRARVELKLNIHSDLDVPPLERSGQSPSQYRSGERRAHVQVVEAPEGPLGLMLSEHLSASGTEIRNTVGHLAQPQAKAYEKAIIG